MIMPVNILIRSNEPCYVVQIPTTVVQWIRDQTEITALLSF